MSDIVKEALAGLVEAATAEFNEKGAGGYALARLSDARDALAALAERGEERERIALAIHDARYAHPEHPRRPDPFTDRGDREYAFRLADAALAAIRAGGSDGH